MNLTLCDPMNRSTPGLPVHHQLIIYSNSCLSSRWCHPDITFSVVPFPPAPNPSKHQGLFQWVNSLHEVAKVLGFQLQHQSFQWTPRTNLLQDGLIGSPCSPRDSQLSSPIPQFKSISFPALGSFLRAGWILSVLPIFVSRLPMPRSVQRTRGLLTHTYVFSSQLKNLVGLWTWTNHLTALISVYRLTKQESIYMEQKYFSFYCRFHRAPCSALTGIKDRTILSH